MQVFKWILQNLQFQIKHGDNIFVVEIGISACICELNFKNETIEETKSGHGQQKNRILKCAIDYENSNEDDESDYYDDDHQCIDNDDNNDYYYCEDDDDDENDEVRILL